MKNQRIHLNSKLTHLRKIIKKLESLKVKYFKSVKDVNKLEPHLEVFTELEAEKLEVRLRKLLLFHQNKLIVLKFNIIMIQMFL